MQASWTAVDVVVPFLGSPTSLAALAHRLERLERGPSDTLTVADNGRRGKPHVLGDVRVIPCGELRTPAHARNRGAAPGTNPWVVFFDADTEPATDLLRQFFSPLPAGDTGLLGGGVQDEEVAPDAPLAIRYSHLRQAMSQDDTFRFGRFGYPKSANIAVRRAAFAQVGGFRASIRAAEDADLAYRLRAAGWATERRENALVIHRARETAAGFARQKLTHGAGGAWLERHYPGCFPARRRPGLIWWGARHAFQGTMRAARDRDRDKLAWALMTPLETLAWEFGRSLPNERPIDLGTLRRTAERLIPPPGTPRI